MEWRGGLVTPAVERAFIETNLIAGREFQSAIASRVWDWPRLTQRRAGAPVGSPRNIVDMGQLLNSYAPRKVSNREYVHSWPVRHALPVHEGTPRMPARRWTEYALKQWSFENTMNRLARNEVGAALMRGVIA